VKGGSVKKARARQDPASLTKTRVGKGGSMLRGGRVTPGRQLNMTKGLKEMKELT